MGEPPLLELLRLRTASTTYIHMLRDLEPWLDVRRTTDPRYGRLLDSVRIAIRRERQNGTPAAIARVAGELLDEH